MILSQAKYGTLLQRRGEPTMTDYQYVRYETLDDSPMGGRDGFGLWSCTSQLDTSKWRAKPEVASVGLTEPQARAGRLVDD